MAAITRTHTKEILDQVERKFSGDGRRSAIECLKRLREQGDPEEKGETLDYLMKALDEGREGYRKHFP